MSALDIGRGGGQLVALRRLLDGECDENTLCDGPDGADTLIIATVLRALTDPAVLRQVK